MTDPLSSANIDVRYECLDMFPIKWSNAGIEEHDSDGILLEIWRTGGTIQTNVPIPEGSWVELAPTGHTIEAQVICCEQDDYGFFVSVSVNQNQYDHWFPQSYCPPYLRCNDQEIEQFYPPQTLFGNFVVLSPREYHASPSFQNRAQGRSSAHRGRRWMRTPITKILSFPAATLLCTLLLGETPTRASGALTKPR